MIGCENKTFISYPANKNLLSSQPNFVSDNKIFVETTKIELGHFLAGQQLNVLLSYNQTVFSQCTFTYSKIEWNNLIYSYGL